MPHMMRLEQHEVAQIFKTWSNSWLTSYHYHEARRLLCLLGCPGDPDSLSRYCHCPIMHILMLQTLGQPEDWNGLDWLGIANPWRIPLKCIASMYVLRISRTTCFFQCCFCFCCQLRDRRSISHRLHKHYYQYPCGSQEFRGSIPSCRLQSWR